MDRKWIVCVLLIVFAACTPATSANQPSSSQSSSTPAENAGPRTEHRIGVRLVAGHPEFYDKHTGQRFVPIGPNFHLLGPENDYVVDHLFVPGQYDPQFVDEQFELMRQLGYTVVRTAFELCQEDCIGAGGGLRGDFIDNIVDFLQRAKAHGLFVILTSNDFPYDAGYIPQIEATCCSPFDGYMNSHYLAPVGVQQWTKYWKELVQALIDRGAPLDAIMAYKIRGELFLFPDTPPLSLTSGKVTTANGKTYDMADPAQKEAMIYENVEHWVNTVSAGIRQLDPTALITVGIFPPNEPNVWRADLNRYVPTAAAFANTSIDYLDLHPYPGYVPLDQMIENYELGAFTDRPIVMGEFGGFKFVYESPQSAASGLQDWQVASCAYGIQGWIFWHWTGTNDHEVWTGSEGEGAIRETLAPANRPDPCQRGVFDFFENNLALGKPARASASTSDGPPEMAFDNSRNTFWQSGGGPQQWIEVDLGAPITVREVHLFTSQYPDGDTVHQIYAAGADHNLQLVHEFRGFTRGDQELTHAFPQPLEGIQFLRILTVQTPSWVSWKEIEVFGTP